jgi:hypothetical protein
MRLEEIVSEPILTGLDLDSAAHVITVRWIGGNAVAVTGRVSDANDPVPSAPCQDEALLSAAAPRKQTAFDA